jgi:hypothetical protein
MFAFRDSIGDFRRDGRPVDVVCTRNTIGLSHGNLSDGLGSIRSESTSI